MLSDFAPSCLEEIIFIPFLAHYAWKGCACTGLLRSWCPLLAQSLARERLELLEAAALAGAVRPLSCYCDRIIGASWSEKLLTATQAIQETVMPLKRCYWLDSDVWVRLVPGFEKVRCGQTSEASAALKVVGQSLQESAEQCLCSWQRCNRLLHKELVGIRLYCI